MKTTGEILKEFRKDNDIKLQELSEKLGVSQPLLTYIENNQRAVTKNILELFQLFLPSKIFFQIEEYENYKRTPDSIKKELKINREKIVQLEKELLISKHKLQLEKNKTTGMGSNNINSNYIASIEAGGSINITTQKNFELIKEKNLSEVQFEEIMKYADYIKNKNK